MPLVDVLVDVFYCFNCCTNLHIDMAIVFCSKIWVIRYNIPVVIFKATFYKGPAIVWPSIFWITIITILSIFTKFLSEMFTAMTICHALCMWISSTTWTMNHMLCDSIIKNRMCNRIRNLCRYNRIHI